MSEKQWEEVERYFADGLGGVDEALRDAVERSRQAGLPDIQVSASEGRFLHVLAHAVGAKRVLEIGTLGGYSAIWLARALAPGGRLTSLEADARHAEVARVNIARAGLSDVVEVRVGRALDTLPGVEADGLAPFDLVFIDADKKHNPDYFAWALKLARPGRLIVVDNVVRDGRVTDASSADRNVQGSRAAFDFFREHPELDTTALQTVGLKGYDGFALALVR